jgi:hypothetical protein
MAGNICREFNIPAKTESRTQVEATQGGEILYHYGPTTIG